MDGFTLFDNKKIFDNKKNNKRFLSKSVLCFNL